MPLCEPCEMALMGYAPKYPFEHKDIQYGGGQVFLGLPSSEEHQWSEEDAFDRHGLHSVDGVRLADLHPSQRSQTKRLLSYLAQLRLRWPQMRRRQLQHSPDGLPTLLGEEAFSIKHHASLEELKQCAETCNVCALIHKSTTSSVEDYVRAQLREQEYFISAGMSPHQPSFDTLGDPEEYRLSVVRCREGRDGVLVFVNPKPAVYLVVAALGMSVLPESILAPAFRGRPIEEDVQESTLDHAASWVADCAKNHRCGISKKSKLPLRVLDISARKTKGEIVLRETQGRSDRYAALSHCWGKKGHFITNKANKTDRMAGIDLQALPLSFQEAIQVVERMGLSFLWIDSLCICQDDAQEWARESAKMGTLYANAYVVIAADNAPDATHSMFRRTRPEYAVFPDDAEDGMHVFSIPVKSEIDHGLYVQLDDEPLSKRAWGLQERHLARRILHFASDQMHFECNEAFLSENGFRAQGRLSRVYDSRTSYRRYSITSQRSRDHSAWYHTLVQYTSRELTYPSDMLPGISGLAKVWEKRLKAKYVAGLWSNALIEGLLWSPIGPEHGAVDRRNRLQWTGPSWSWVAQLGPTVTGTRVEVLGPRVYTEMAKVIDFHVELKTSDPHGEIKSAWIKLQTPIERVEFVEPWSEQPHPDGRRREFTLRFRKNEEEDNFGQECSFDHNQMQWPPDDEIQDWIKKKEFYALMMMKETHEVMSSCFYMALIVSPAATQGQQPTLRAMERWGCARLFFSPEKCTDLETVVLV